MQFWRFLECLPLFQAATHSDLPVEWAASSAFSLCRAVSFPHPHWVYAHCLQSLLKQHLLNKAYPAAAAKSLQSCPTLCDPIDSSPAGSPIPGILQARTLEWVAISFSNARKWKLKVKSLSRVQLLATPWTAAYQAPLPMGFSRQQYWSGVPLPSLKNLSSSC